jgi:hypothetical protein
MADWIISDIPLMISGHLTWVIWFSSKLSIFYAILRANVKFRFGSITSVYDQERKMENFINDRRLENIYS